MSLSEKCVAFRVDNLLGLDAEKISGCSDSFRFKSRREISENDIEDLRGNARVELCSRELWLKFYELGTEMIITKAGRRMFPTVRIQISGLEENKFYSVFLELMPIDDRRYRFNHIKGRWEPCVGDKMTSTEKHSGIVMHPSSPSSGKNWKSHGLLSFDRIKLTNKKRPMMKDHVHLDSMHKYMVKIHIIISNTKIKENLDLNRGVSFSFPETTFVAVTAYQNHKITKLKCACNPFATGYRSIRDNPLAANQITLSSGHSPPRRADDYSVQLPGNIEIIYTDKVVNGDVAHSEKSKNSLTRIATAKSNSVAETNKQARRFIAEKSNLMIRKPIKFVIPPLNKNIMTTMYTV